MKWTPFKVDTSLRRMVLLYTDGFPVKLLQQNLYKTDTCKADSHKTDTFFVYQMKNLPKKLSVKQTLDKIKIYFLCKEYSYIFS